ncbi:MAG: carbohydrate kinase family protein [Rubrobacteraceae bacterium]|nr:carbohydrate kinase family protein [Rubrobacteraceae bacterium]
MDVGRRGRVIVAGHLCLDLIPELPGRFDFVPGTMVGAGPMRISTGGSVSNTGLSLHRLGAEVTLVARIGKDPLGELVHRHLESSGEGLSKSLIVSPAGETSYTLILSPPDEDRMFLHYSGVSADFSADDLPEPLPPADILHFGYPQVLPRFYEDRGELGRLFERARRSGTTTSLDTCFPDLSSEAGRVDWRTIFEEALPAVDLFVPSLEEALVMLGPERYRQIALSDTAPLAAAPIEEIRALGKDILAMGAAVAGIKCGRRGLYLRTAPEARLARAGRLLSGMGSRWADRELWGSTFEVEVRGTVGAGDAAYAGLLFGMLLGMDPEEALTAACAAGACCVEAHDTTSGVRSWEETRRRMEGGWQRSAEAPEGWAPGRIEGVWLGPADSS